ncbi:MAG: hypothetical protein Q9174_003642, partial [Haloplaca sp. 1 TL-2023]
MASPGSSVASTTTSPSGSKDTLELTPRSKVKAMMAAVDDDSDSDAVSQPVDHLLGTKQLLEPVQDQVETDGMPTTADDSDTIASKKPSRPRGKIAARLQGRISESSDDGREDINDSNDAYARIRKRLANRSTRSTSEDQHVNAPKMFVDTDEEGTLQAVTTRRKTQSPIPSDMFESPARSHPPRSPGLFLTPEKETESIASVVSPTDPHSRATHGPHEDSDSDLPANPQTNSRFLALVAKKRAEREARAKAEQDKKAQRRPQTFREELNSAEDSDAVSTKRLTQHTRPTRKASKKALEEMNRETQRMSRNMQLAHQARTKKKITKESLFARFNFRTEAMSTDITSRDVSHCKSSSATVSSNPASDAEARVSGGTPPTSPPGPASETKGSFPTHQGSAKVREACMVGQPDLSGEDLPDAEDIIRESQATRGESRAHKVDNPILDSAPVTFSNAEKGTMRSRIQIRPPKTVAKQDVPMGSDNDLEILPKNMKKRKTDVFDRLPAKKPTEERSLQQLRALAHLSSPSKRVHGKKACISMSDMQNLLQRRARQQAARERSDRIQELKDKGVIVQTAEEREKDQAEVEDLLEKARKNAVELKQHERAAAKKQAKAAGQDAPADASSDEDDDYEDNDADESALELSGSDEEGQEADVESDAENSDEDESVLETKDDHARLVEDEASESSDEGEEDKATEEADQSTELAGQESDESVSQDNHKLTRRNNAKVVLDDEDDEMPEDEATHTSATQSKTPGPAIPGLPALDEDSMGLTQAFAATMADSQTQAHDQQVEGDQEEDSLAFLGPPEPAFALYDMDDSLDMIADSQGMDATESQSQQKIVFDYTQSQMQDTGPYPSGTQMSEIPEPSQDVGFTLSSPIPNRFASVPPSTVDTVILPRDQVAESPLVKKRGRLRRRTDAVVNQDSDAEMDGARKADNMTMSANAFDVLKIGSKKRPMAQEAFDKKKSKANEMIEEQAQESEDEYAGLGGASDEESGGEMDEEVQKMIEQGEVDVDERQLAAFYANKERASDEKAVEKLFKDINNGMLRRKRGADFDLSDSEDDAEARQRRKRREFAKMRKALLENENVGKIAEDPKKMAFLRAIEDRDGDDGLHFLDEPEESADVDSQELADSQSQANQEESATALGKRKRALTDAPPEKTNRLPANARRTVAARKPASLADIRASVSFLTEAPDAMPMPPPSSSPPASDNENDENADTGDLPSNVTHNKSNNPFTSRRTSNPVIDRLSLKRTSTSSSNASTSSSRLAFHDPLSSTTAGFKVPSLLRRATTSSFNNNNGNGNGKQDSNGISTLAETE